MSPFSFMTALSESLSLMIICDVFSLSIPTYLLFSQIGKQILDIRLYIGWPIDVARSDGQQRLYSDHGFMRLSTSCKLWVLCPVTLMWHLLTKLQPVLSHSTHCCHFHRTSKIPRTSIPCSNSDVIKSWPCFLFSISLTSCSCPSLHSCVS